jgi:alpha-amylase
MACAAVSRLPGACRARGARTRRVGLVLVALGLACAEPAPETGGGATPDAGVPKGPPIAPNEQGWWRDDVVYQVFVRSFADSDGDGVGDLKGLIARLDALNDGDPATTDDLGVDALWLMPIFATDTYHGYDVKDYLAVNPEYGTLEDFQALTRAAHERGIRIILDFVMNHSSRAHPWFVEAEADPGAARRSWYRFRADDPGWRRPWDRRPVWHAGGGGFYYGLFGAEMPDLDLANPAVEDELLRIAETWLERGADGFRVDAARHLIETEAGVISDAPETHAFVRRFRQRLHERHPQALLAAEAWIDVDTLVDYWGEGCEFSLAFSFDLAGAIKAAVRDGDPAPLTTILDRSAAAFPDRGFEAPFLSNHDMERTMTTLGRDADRGALAAAILLGLPGTPFLYYGEELGMAGAGTPFEEDRRAPYRWNGTGPGYGFTTGTPWQRSIEEAGVDLESQRRDPGSLWSTYRALIALRHAEPALADGPMQRVEVEGGPAVAWTRSAAGRRLLFVANLGPAPVDRLRVAVPAARPERLLGRGAATATITGGAELVVQGLAGRGFLQLVVDP